MAPSVLVVEDEEAVALTLREILLEEGYRVEGAASADEAFAKIDHDHFDVAVLDLRVADDSGLAVLTRLKEVSPDTAALILTGYGSLDTAVQAMRQGAFDYLLKPCDVRELKASIARGIAQRQALRSATLARHELEKAVTRAEDARDDFLAIAGHELKTPLSAVIGWAQYVRRQLERGETDVLGRLDDVVHHARRLARLVDAFIDVSRIQDGRLDLAVERHDLRSILARVVRDARSSFSQHDFRLAMPDEPLWVRVDAERLAQLFGSVLENASKFSPTGGLIETTVQPRHGRARVEVRDQGVGLTPEERAHVFDLFYQADRDVMSRRFGGVGIGLYVSRALAEAHGGSVDVESPGPGQGSSVFVEIPLA